MLVQKLKVYLKFLKSVGVPHFEKVKIEKCFRWGSTEENSFGKPKSIFEKQNMNVLKKWKETKPKKQKFKGDWPPLLFLVEGGRANPFVPLGGGSVATSIQSGLLARMPLSCWGWLYDHLLSSIRGDRMATSFFFFLFSFFFFFNFCK
jgi:hypothetical protein